MSLARSTLLSALLLLAACAAPTAVQREALKDIPFDAQQYARYAGKGTASLQGECYVRQSRGRVSRATGQRVYLTPVTGVSTAVVEDAMDRQVPFSPDVDPRVAGLTREAVSDGGGRFRFESLPAGDYYLVSTFARGARRGLAPVVVTARLDLQPDAAVQVNLVAE